MARIRTIKPEFFRHEELQDMERDNPGAYVMLVFAGLWGHCDSKGRFAWKPRSLKLDILPFLDFDISLTLELLAIGGFIEKYTVDGKDYGFVPTFNDNQRIEGKEKESGERYPEKDGEATGKQWGSNGEAPEKQPEVQEGKGKEKERNGKEETRASRLDPLGIVDLLPETHRTPEVVECLRLYEKHRIENKWKPWKESTLQEKAKQWSVFPPDVLVQAMRKSIENGWQGIFPDRISKPPPTPADRKRQLLGEVA